MIFKEKARKMTELSIMPPVNDGIQVTSSIVQCDGGGKGTALGHPLVYLNMGEQGQITCPYCSRQFILIDSPF